ncbi:MAG: hypothetical protein JNL32_03480, partial [Candidatus Kapabacteria bacterium]|nr:hypothetical protein [Candidatus Kapabacteria bacterium]
MLLHTLYALTGGASLRLLFTTMTSIERMDSLRRIFLLLAAAFIIPVLFVSCEKENWDLVSPPTGRDSIMVRFLNLAGDAQARTMSLEGGRTTTSVAFGSVSETVMSPSDSSFITLANGSGDYRSSVRKRFIKNAQETIIAFPSPVDSANRRVIDTVISFSTPRNQNIRPGFGHVRIINASNTTRSTYLFKIGCQNGPDLGGTAYRTGTVYTDIPTGTFVVSLIKDFKLFNIYSFDVRQSGYYSIVHYETAGGTTVSLIDELNNTTQALLQPVIVDASKRSSKFRVVNFSRTQVDAVSTFGGQSLALNLPAMRTSSYADITACESDTSDVIELLSGGMQQSELRIAIGVLARYSIVVSDDPAKGTTASRMTLVPPLTTMIPADSCIVRVVNALDVNSPVRVRLGARTLQSGEFKNGEQIAQSVAGGRVSERQGVAPGFAPLMVVSADQSERLLGCFVAQLEKGKEYLFIVGSLPGASGIEMSMIQSSDESSAITPLPQGVFAQVVNARYDRTITSIGTPPVLSSASMTFGNSIASVYPQGTIILSNGSLTKSINADTLQRITIILTGDNSSQDAILLSTQSMRPAI